MGPVVKARHRLALPSFSGQARRRIGCRRAEMPLGPPTYRASALRQLETEQNTVDKGSVETAPLVLDGPCTVHTARLHNHTRRQCAFAPSGLWPIASYLLAGFRHTQQSTSDPSWMCKSPASLCCSTRPTHSRLYLTPTTLTTR